MTGRRLRFTLIAAVLALAVGRMHTAVAQTSPDQAVSPQQTEELPTYRPPPRGAPGGRVGGASRGTFIPPAPLPTIELLAPRDHAGLTADPAPPLYFFVSGRVAWPTRFTIRAPDRPVPVVDAAIPPPAAAGIYRLDLAALGVRLESGILYTWSVAAIVDPRIPARDIVASATLLRRLGAVPAAAASPVRRAVLCAQDGLWYDAVAAAVAAEEAYGRAALDALLREVGLTDAAAYAGPAAFRPR